MVTAPLGKPIFRGRGASNIRTPQLIRDYLSGIGDFPEDTPEERDARPTQGDYLARMHRRIKLFIRTADPDYQYPRHHSFVALINNLLTLGLLEETGVQEDPEERGAGVLGTAGGFKQRVYVRITPGSFDRREWADPIGFISLIYSNVRPAERPLPLAVSRAPAAPAREVPGVRLGRIPPDRLQELEQRRLAIVNEARRLENTGNSVSEFQGLLRRATMFVNEVTEALPPRPFPAAPEALNLLQNCIQILSMERQISPRRVTAVINCQASSRILADALSTPLLALGAAPPGMVPVIGLPDFELPDTPSRNNAAILARHLQLLQRLGADRGDVQGRIQELTEDLEQWVDQVNDAIAHERRAEQPRQDRIAVLQRILRGIEDAGSELGIGEIGEALAALGRAYPPRETQRQPPRPAQPTPTPPAPTPPSEERPQVASISLPSRFSTRSVPRLLDHFQVLVDLAEASGWPEVEFPELAEEVERLKEAGEEWRDVAQESLENEEARDNPRESRLESLQERVDVLQRYVEALGAQDLGEAIGALEEIG